MSDIDTKQTALQICQATGRHRPALARDRCSQSHAVYGRCVFTRGHKGEHQGQTHNRLTAWARGEP